VEEMGALAMGDGCAVADRVAEMWNSGNLDD
jgi:hypothetical protein